MKIFKNIKDGKLYILNELKTNVYVAIPLEKGGLPINDCKMSEFVPVSDSPRVDGR
jgi:hypothetical protein